jgi:hypothetical protein
VKDGHVYAFTTSERRYVYTKREFLARWWEYDWYWHPEKDKWYRASDSTVSKYRRVIQSGEYESADYGKSYQQVQKERVQWEREARQRRQMREARKTLAAIRKHLRPRLSPTTASPQVQTSPE